MLNVRSDPQLPPRLIYRFWYITKHICDPPTFTGCDQPLTLPLSSFLIINLTKKITRTCPGVMSGPGDLNPELTDLKKFLLTEGCADFMSLKLMARKVYEMWAVGGDDRQRRGQSREVPGDIQLVERELLCQEKSSWESDLLRTKHIII